MTDLERREECSNGFLRLPVHEGLDQRWIYPYWYVSSGPYSRILFRTYEVRCYRSRPMVHEI